MSPQKSTKQRKRAKLFGFLLVIGVLLCCLGCPTADDTPQKPVPHKSKTKAQRGQRTQPLVRRQVPIPDKRQPSAPRKSTISRLTETWKRAKACCQKKRSCPTPGSLKVTTWLHDKRASLSLTYDDSMPVQYKYIYPIQKEFGFKATFFLYTRELLRRRSTDWGQSIRNWKHWRVIRAEGNEIGSHSVSHPHLSKVPFSQAKRELVQSCRTIKEKIPQAKCETIAYPYGDSNARVRRYARRYYLAARQAKQGVNPPNPPDMMNVKSVIPFGSTSMRSLERRIKRSLRKKGWTVWMFHGTKDQGWEPLPLTRFRAIFKLIKGYEERLWIGTFGDVAKYIKQRQQAKLQVLQAGPKGIKFRLRHKLDKRYTQTMTVALSVPAEWTQLLARQGKAMLKPIPTKSPKGCSCLRKILLNIQPNGGEVQLLPKP